MKEKRWFIPMELMHPNGRLVTILFEKKEAFLLDEKSEMPVFQCDKEFDVKMHKNYYFFKIYFAYNMRYLNN